MKTDLVVIGGGTAGLAAALTAMEHGIKKVILLEKRINYGGNSSMAGGFLFGAESRLQKKAGNITYKDRVLNEDLEYHHLDRINPKLIRALINKSGETIDWLEDQGLVFELGIDDAHVIKGKFDYHVMQYSLAMETLANKITEKGGQILLRTAAKKVLRDEEGAVSGVAAATRAGEEINIKCKSVVLSPGGFTGNKELLMKYFGYDDFATEAVPLKGDGIKMAEEAGAYMEDYATLCQHGVHPKYVSLETIKNQPNHFVLTSAYSIWVNARGERFHDATIPIRLTDHLIFRQPGKTAYVILDDKLLQSALEVEFGPGMASKMAAEDMIRLRKELQDAAQSGVNVCMSDNWTVIAEYIGAQPAALQATIDEYNVYCDRGVDDVFGKDKKYLKALSNPPYYAIRLQAAMVEAIGPVRINERMEVLDKKEDPIPGFYAAGAITSGWCGHDYHLFGSNLGFGTTGGRIAGENAATYISKSGGNNTE
jgi:fumarate reductase flavoprotein subunit